MVKNVIYIIVAAVFVVAYFRYFEHKSLYFPMKEIEFMPSDVGLSYEDVYFNTDDGVRLNAWLVPAEDSRFTLLFCHGNGGNISHRIDKIEILNKLGLDIFIFDYRGYGKSEGRPSEKGFYRDMEAAYNYLISEKNVSPERMILYGESLGGAVAIDLAAKKTAKALITESTFSCTKDMVRVLFPVFPTFLISSNFDSATKIKKLTIPKLIIHSKNDDIVPFEHSLKLLKLSPEPKKHVVLMGNHNSAFLDSRDTYVSGIREFLRGL
ncbi:MAG: alpha/beta hydrolase [Candidatus Omnitrophica bacterium]|nr:alpha/beta hydrolase [Candidatus Omnitrophota bacterium]MBU4590131.1 alpha/beta hydrolase [Candidatus Omnitrophota bacterium]